MQFSAPGSVPLPLATLAQPLESRRPAGFLFTAVTFQLPAVTSVTQTSWSVWPGLPARGCPTSDAQTAAVAVAPTARTHTRVGMAGSPSTGAQEKAAKALKPPLQRPGHPQSSGVTVVDAGSTLMKAAGHTASRLPTRTWARSLVIPGHNIQPSKSLRKTQSSQHSLLLCLVMSYDVGSI